CLAGCGHATERSERDEQRDDDEPGTAHCYSFFSIVLSSCVIILSPSTPPWSRSSSRTSAAIVGVAAGRLVNTLRILGELRRPADPGGPLAPGVHPPRPSQCLAGG